MKKSCFSCGMPMSKEEDYPKGDKSLEYCIHCACEDGSLKSFKEKMDDMTVFIMNANVLDFLNARIAAKEVLSRMPAWKGSNFEEE